MIPYVPGASGSSATPLIELKKMAEGSRHRLFAKIESVNSTGSMKDRVAVAMLEAGEAVGIIRPGVTTLVEATGGNTGISLAALGRQRGYDVICTMSEKMSPDKVISMERLGATVITCPELGVPDDPRSFYNTAKAIGDESGCHFLDQFNNTANIAAHYWGTGKEIWDQTGGAVDVFLAGAGTGGTLRGVGTYLKERNSSTRVVLVDPIGSVVSNLLQDRQATLGRYLVEGVGGDSVPPFLTDARIDDFVRVADAESAEFCARLLAEEDVFAGPSSGMVVAAALRYLREVPGDGKIFVVPLADSGDRYRDTWFDHSWLDSKDLAGGVRSVADQFTGQ